MENNDHGFETFGEALRTFRKRAGMTLRDLANESAYSATMLSAFERGKKGPPTDPEKLAQISFVLKDLNAILSSLSQQACLQVVLSFEGRSPALRSLAIVLEKRWNARNLEDEEAAEMQDYLEDVPESTSTELAEIEQGASLAAAISFEQGTCDEVGLDSVA